ncbi:hypothetical protein [Nonomuraea sp. LPB2021202275-12-8]|uniref:hypothetical protein n=1 Tax=Nonomuraea sp. LPB2021202275-12-8 TaxID=3120159 RepID=UPI00300C2E55
MSTPPPPERPHQTGLIVGLAFVGVFGYLIINVVVGFLALATESTAWFGVAAGFLALVGIGAGLVLLIMRRPWSKGLGMGLMIGWALASIVSAGWCTGLNPGLYP